MLYLNIPNICETPPSPSPLTTQDWFKHLQAGVQLWPGALEMIQVFISVYIETGWRLLIFGFLQFETWLLNIVC